MLTSIIIWALLGACPTQPHTERATNHQAHVVRQESKKFFINMDKSVWEYKPAVGSPYGGDLK